IVTWVPRDARPGMPPATPPAVRWRGKAFLFERSPIFTWARHTLVDARFVVAIPRDVATDVTAIIGCAVLTGAGAVLNTARVRPGESVAIFGVGGVGLSAVQAAANVGAHPIIAVDLSEEKLAFAQRFGATHGLNAATTDVVSEIQQLTGGGVDYAFDAIGAPQTQVQILQVTRPGILGFGDGGMSILVGIPQQPVSLDLKTLVRGQKIYRGSWGGSTRPERDFPLYIRWFQEGKLPLEALVTRRYSLEQINEAVEELAQGRVLGRSILELK
ncbi:MAG: alcohol dehydrogenase, partial [Nitrospinota bacterium]